jgi:molybdate transport system ATP-binding protein
MVVPIIPPDLAVRIHFERHSSSASPFVLDAAFDVPPGITILFGPSGAGKSTILDCIAGLVRPHAGSIAIGGEVVFDSSRKINLRPQHRRAAYMFQKPALFPHMTVEQNVAYGLAKLRVDERVSRVRQILAAMRIENVLDRKPREISGGEAQRVALARSLVTLPRVLLLDEPLTGLDVMLKSSIVDDLRAWNSAHGIPIVYVTHNRDEVDAIGERVIVLDHGQVIASGSTSNVLDAPRSKALARAAGFENLLRGEVMDIRENDGVMRVQLNAGGTEDQRSPGSPIGVRGIEPAEIEVPVSFAQVGTQVVVAIRAGDILVAMHRPIGSSARNVLEGRVLSLERRGTLVAARVDAGVVFQVHLTSGAARSLEVAVGMHVWLVLNTHSCHLASE